MRQPLAVSRQRTGNASGQGRIVKIGGSLLDWPLLRDRLAAWLAVQSKSCNVLLAGGGDLTDAIRRAQAIHRFDDQDAHWMCVRALSVTSQILSRLLPDAQLATSLDELLAADWSEGSLVVFDPASWMLLEEPHASGQPLPHDWTATTDSIAARLAILTSVSELVLLKSADPLPATSLGELAAAGYVDRHFPAAAAALPLVRLVNLRNASSRDSLFHC
jgi:aspartokinase-like uncharacterized kinase